MLQFVSACSEVGHQMGNMYGDIAKGAMNEGPSAQACDDLFKKQMDYLIQEAGNPNSTFEQKQYYINQMNALRHDDTEELQKRRNHRMDILKLTINILTANVPGLVYQGVWAISK